MAQIYDVKRNVAYEESAEQEDERLRKILAGIWASKKEAERIERDKFKRGYCARCGLLLPLGGKCDNCGCTERRKPYIPPTPPRNEIVDHRRGMVKGGYVNPAILKMYDK